MADPNDSSGLGGLLGGSSGGGGGLLGVDPSMLLQLGLGLMSAGAKNSPLRGNWAMGAQQGLQNYQQQRAANQQYQLQNLQTRMAMAQWQADMPIYKEIGERFHRMNNDPTTPMQVQGLLGSVGAPQGAAPMPQGAPPAPQGGPLLPQAGQMPPAQNAPPGAPPLPPMGPMPAAQTPPQAPAPNRYRPPAPLPTVGGDPMGDTQFGTLLQALPQFQKYGEALTNQATKQQAVQETLVKQRQQQVAPQLSDLDTIMTSADADTRLRKDSDLMSLWQQENGNQPLTPPAARAFAGTVYNRLAGATQSPVKPIPTMLQTTQRGLGESIQTDPVSGKITSGASAVPTDKYIVNGNVVELSKAEGVRRGLTPYDSTLLGAQQITPEALEQAYQVAKTKGDITESLAGRDPVAAAKVSSYIAQRAKEDNLTGVAMAAQQQAFKSSQDVLNDFLSPKGTAGSKLTAINTTVAHSQTLLPLIDALGTGNLTKINQAKLAYQEATGKTAPTDYKVIANMYAGEASNAITAAGGDAEERAAIKAPYSSVHSPAQLKSAVQLTAQALAGKTEALRNQWDVGTQGMQGSFDKLLLPETKTVLAGGAPQQHPPNIQKLLNKYSPNAARSQ